MTKVYSKEEAKAVSDRIKNINLINKNKKSNARRDAEDLKNDLQLNQLIEHCDSLYYEGLFEDEVN